MAAAGIRVFIRLMFAVKASPVQRRLHYFRAIHVPGLRKYDVYFLHASKIAGDLCKARTSVERLRAQGDDLRFVAEETLTSPCGKSGSLPERT